MVKWWEGFEIPVAHLAIESRIGGPKWKFKICGKLQFCGNLVGNSGAGRSSCHRLKGFLAGNGSASRLIGRCWEFICERSDRAVGV